MNDHRGSGDDDFKIFGSGFGKNRFKRKVAAEAYLIKELRATLNVQMEL